MPLGVVAGHRTHYEITGRGERPVLFIHCTLAHSGAWSGVAADLAPHLRMILFDRPGHGLSAGWSGTDALALHDLTTTIAAHLIEDNADVVGHSWGATVALRLAMEHANKVRSLTLIEPVAMKAASDHPSYRDYRTAMDRFAAFLREDRHRDAARLFNDMISPEAPFDALPAAHQDKLADRIPLVAAETGVTLDDTPGLLAPGRLEALTQPVLLIEGARSPAMIHAVMDALAARLPKARRTAVDGAGHMAPITHPRAVAGHIATFLKL